MAEEDSMDTAEIICGLKAALTALECQQNVQMARQRAADKERDKHSSQVYMMLIPVDMGKDDAHKHKKSEQQQKKCSTKADCPAKKAQAGCSKPNDHHKAKECNNNNRQQHQEHEEEVLKFPEMRGSMLYTRCSCLFRDGLQDECPLTNCLWGKHPGCDTKPWPECPPAKDVRRRFPEIYPMPPKKSKTCCIDNC